MKKILVPVDDADFCGKTLEMAVDLGQRFGAEILILHVQPYFEPMSYPYAHMAEITVAPDAFREVSERIVTSAKAKFDGSGLVVNTMTVDGNPASEIVSLAESEQCDLILMCTHGMGAARRFLLGSVTNRVVHHATVPVLVVR